MIQLLIVSDNPHLPESIRVLLSPPDRFELHEKPDVESAVHLLEIPVFDACLLDGDLTNIDTIRRVERLRKANPEILLIVLAGEIRKEWEEEAYLKGVDFILSKPVRGKLLNNLLNKILPNGQPGQPPMSRPQAPPPPSVEASPAAPLPALEILRDFSRIFSFSLNLKSFTYQFALKLREIISVSRIAIFLEHTPSSPFNPAGAEQPKRLKCLCSVGIEPELFDYLALSSRSGIGQAVLKSGRILRSNPAPNDILFPPDPEIQREFELLGGQIAIPILDRERAIGVAVMGDRLTGHSFSNEELQLLFHLMEELGMAIKSNLLHDQLLANHKLISSVFSQMSSGCVVVDPDLNILHANPASVKFLKLSTPIQFSHLPRQLASQLYESAHAGKDHRPFLYTDPAQPDASYRVSIVPFNGENDAPGGAMMFVEDFTLIEAAKKADLEASNLRLVALIAEKFAHEIRNALLPIETCRQLLPERLDDPEFRKTLEHTLKQESGRIGRFTDQLLHLSKQDLVLADTESIATLLQDAFAQAKPLIKGTAELQCSDDLTGYRMRCNSSSLKYAFFEILLNGFQANPDRPKVTVSAHIADGTNGTNLLTVKFRDEGPGLSPELSEKAVEPFFTTRNVGVGLGLSVTRKIVEGHRGSLAIKSPGPGEPGGITVSLPVSKTPAT